MCVQYIGGCSVHRGVFSTSRGYHEYIGGISWVHRRMFSTFGNVQYIEVFNRNWKDFIKLLPHMYHDILPMYWTSPDVLMISPRCTHDIPPMYWTSPDVLNIPRCIMVSPRCTEHPPMYSWYPPMYSWYPPDVLNTPRCTEHPPMYWTHIIQGDCDIQKKFTWGVITLYITGCREKIYCTNQPASLRDCGWFGTVYFLPTAAYIKKYHRLRTVISL